VQETRRYGLAGALSLLAHLVFVFWGVWSLDIGLEAPEFEFEFETVELVDPDLLQGEEKAPEPPVVAPPEASPGPEEKPGPEEPEEPEPEPKFGDKHSKVDRLGPTNSTFFMLLATKKVAKLPFAEEAAEVMAPLPDFELIVQGGGFHPFRDFDHLVLASPDIRDVTQTFLAVEYKLPRAELKAGLERAAAAAGESITWELREGLEMANPVPDDPSVKDWDPRWFVILDDRVAVYVREEFLPQIIAGPDASKGKTAGNFVANIAKMRRFTQQEPRAGLQLVMKDIRAALKSAKGLPFEVPDDLEIMAEASAEPELLIRLRFPEASHARDAERFWREDLKKIIDGDLRIKFVAGGFYASTEVEQSGTELLLRNRFDGDQTRTILQLIADGSRKMMRKSKEEMDERRKARQEMWEARKGGKLLPSQVLAEERGEKDPAPLDPPANAPEPPPAPTPG
jgi:hypothetical protein